MKYNICIKSVKKKLCKTRYLKGKPQIRGTVFRIYRTTPRKPNSAIRVLAQVLIFTDTMGRKLFAYIPGGNRSRPVVQWNEVLIRGGRTQDVRGLHYKLVRGNRGCKGLQKKREARSKYGAKSLFLALKRLTVSRRPLRKSKFQPGEELRLFLHARL